MSILSFLSKMLKTVKNMSALNRKVLIIILIPSKCSKNEQKCSLSVTAAAEEQLTAWQEWADWSQLSLSAALTVGLTIQLSSPSQLDMQTDDSKTAANSCLCRHGLRVYGCHSCYDPMEELNPATQHRFNKLTCIYQDMIISSMPTDCLLHICILNDP